MNTNLRQKFLNLPQPVINWLTSDSATNTIIKINERLGLEGDLLKIIPSLISRLVIQDLKPEEFIKELALRLDFDSNQGAGIIREIYLSILKPIEAPLKDALGFNLNTIFAASPPSTPPQPIQQIVPITLPNRPIYPAYTPIKPASPLPPTRFATPTIPAQNDEIKIAPPSPEAIADEVKPFLLHEEGPTTLLQPTPSLAKPILPTSQDKSLKPSFSFTPPKPPTPKIPPRPIPKSPQVKIEGVKTKNYPKKTKTDEIRLVHYSQFKTIL